MTDIAAAAALLPSDYSSEGNLFSQKAIHQESRRKSIKVFSRRLFLCNPLRNFLSLNSVPSHDETFNTCRHAVLYFEER